MDVSATLNNIGNAAKLAASELTFASAEIKKLALINAADFLWSSRSEIMIANSKDMVSAQKKNLSAAMLDRLFLDKNRVKSIRDSLLAVAEQADPVGQIIEDWKRPSGLNIQKVRTPLGVIGVIYESRPNVTADAGALCLKAGNSVILRGGSESYYSSNAIHKAMVQGLIKVGLPETSIQLIPTRDRSAVNYMLTMVDCIDVIIPRGGKGLVDLVQKEARVPVFAHLEGIVHIYIHSSADPQKTFDVVLNAKTRRPGICGAVECILMDNNIAATWGEDLINKLLAHGVTVNVDKNLERITQFSSS